MGERHALGISYSYDVLLPVHGMANWYAGSYGPWIPRSNRGTDGRGTPDACSAMGNRGQHSERIVMRTVV